MFRGFSVRKQEWLYGIHFQRYIDCCVRDFIVPDHDHGLEVFLHSKEEYMVDPKSIGRYCEFFGAYEGDICLVDKEFYILCWDSEQCKFVLRKNKTNGLMDLQSAKKKGVQFTKDTLYQKRNMIKLFDEITPHITASTDGITYGRFLLRQKTENIFNRKIVRNLAYIRMLDKKIALDADSFVSESEVNGENGDILELLPYLQMYIVELASNQKISYQSKDCNNFEVYSYDFCVGEDFYNISTVLSIGTETSLFKYRSKPKGAFVVFPVEETAQKDREKSKKGGYVVEQSKKRDCVDFGVMCKRSVYFLSIGILRLISRATNLMGNIGNDNKGS